LFTAAQQMGAAPARRRKQAEEEARKQQLTGMLKGVTPGTAEYSSILADYYSEVEKDPVKANTLGALAREQAVAQATKIRDERLLSNLRAAGKAKANKSKNAADLLPLVDSMSASELKQYLMPSTPSEFTLSEGQIRFKGGKEIARVAKPKNIVYERDDLLNINTGQVESVRIGYQDGKQVSKEVLGIVPSKDGAGGAGGAGGAASLRNLNLEQLAEERNIEVDYNDINSLRSLQQLAYNVLDDSALGNSFNTLIDNLKEPGVTEGLELLRTNPAVAKAEEDLVLVGKYRALESLSQTDTAGISRLLQRTLTSTVPNDIKALQEMQLFTKSQGLKDRVDDFFSMAVNGRLTEETLKEYSDVMQAIEDFSEYQITSAARNLAVFGNEREQQMAEKIIGYYGGSTARVVD
jgi:hypothetical protein